MQNQADHQAMKQQAGAIKADYQQMQSELNQRKSDTSQVQDQAVEKYMDENNRMWEQALTRNSARGMPPSSTTSA